MRVIEVERRGGPEVLGVAERADPQPGPGQVVAEVAAAGVNYMDIYQREGVGGYRPPLPFVTGGEGAGTVIAVGEGVTAPAVGDRAQQDLAARRTTGKLLLIPLGWVCGKDRVGAGKTLPTRTHDGSFG